MIAVDTNILVYAHRNDSPWNAAAKPLVAGLAEGEAAWAIPWHCLHEFFGVVTHPRICNPPSTIEQAIRQMAFWLDSPSLRILAEGHDYWPNLRETMLAGRITGPQIHDARVAALCQEHGVSTLWSADRDFSRFAGLKVVNPLVR